GDRDMEGRQGRGACCEAAAQGPPRRYSLRRRAATAPGSRLRVAAVGRTAPVQAQLQKPPQPGARARKQQKIGSLSTLDGKSAAKTRALIAPGGRHIQDHNRAISLTQLCDVVTHFWPPQQIPASPRDDSQRRPGTRNNRPPAAG